MCPNYLPESAFKIFKHFLFRPFGGKAGILMTLTSLLLIEKHEPPPLPQRDIELILLQP